MFVCIGTPDNKRHKPEQIGRKKGKPELIGTRNLGLILCSLIWSAANGGLRDEGLVGGNLSKKAFFPLFPGISRCCSAPRKLAKTAEKGRKRPISADFQEGRTDTPETPICYTPICGSPTIIRTRESHKNCSVKFSGPHH